MGPGNHTLNFGGEIQRVDADFDLRVFQQGRIELIEDFPDFDRNGDGRVDDNDLLFAVTLRSGLPIARCCFPMPTTPTSPSSFRTTGECIRSSL